MSTVISPEIKDIIQTVHYRPAVSIIMPFEPKMSLKQELDHSLKAAADKVERNLTLQYPEETVRLVMGKLRSVLKALNYNSFKKSIAIYISPVFEKVLYLDLPVEEKIIIDESFEIRDLVYSKKELHKYLVLLLSGNESKIFLGNTHTFVRILSNTPESVFAYVNETPERVSNFSDPAGRREVVMEKFLHHIDKNLDIILNAYPLPLFLVGTERITGHFKSITRHRSAITGYIHGNYEEASPEALKALLRPHVADWKKVRQRELMNLLEQASGQQKLARGIREVWKAAMQNKGRLLIVEKNYMHAAQLTGEGYDIIPGADAYDRFSYIRDAVDDIIEKVLQNGGDVEFVDPPLLQDFQHVALVCYY